MECTICKLALAAALLVLQPPHSAHPMAFPVHMCCVEKLYVDLYEPHMSNSFATLHAQALLGSVQMPWVEYFHHLDTACR